MRELGKRSWPDSSGEWKPARTLVVSNHGSLPPRPDEVLVKTPLDMIVQLEGAQPISKVVLAGAFANRELASFVLETYPWVGVELPS
jgi:hypothetical protein